MVGRLRGIKTWIAVKLPIEMADPVRSVYNPKCSPSRAAQLNKEISNRYKGLAGHSERLQVAHGEQ